MGNETLGTKQDIRLSEPSSKPTGAIGGGDLLQMGVALAVVLVLLKFVVPKLVTKFGKQTIGKSKGGIVIEESAAFGTGHLNVVAVRGRTLLIGVTQQNVSLVADLTEPTIAEATPEEVEPAFFELLDQAQEIEEAPVAVTDIVDEDPADRRSRIQNFFTATRKDVAEEIEYDEEDVRARLDRLTGA